MPDFEILTPTNGFDFHDLNNARQNNYAWSMSDLGEYIYVGTGRNILLNIISSTIDPNTKIPDLIKPDPVDNLAEIWRFRKDKTLPWKRVYKAPDSSISGFRFMIRHRPFGGSPVLYAAAFGTQVKILKTTNGVNWFILPDYGLSGTSSRAMVVHNGKVYLATIDEANPSPVPLLYSSEDPEFYPWKLVIDSNAPGFNPNKNPKGAISNMAVFNNRIYVATSNDTGVQVWRTIGMEPEMNKWKLVVDNGFGDPDNKYSLSIGVFKEHLYVSGTKELPMAWFIPRGCDIVRIDKNDHSQLVVGGNPFMPSPGGQRHQSLSGLGSGFNNPFNVYAWQIQEYQDKLLVSTFDDSSNMEVILDTLLANRAALESMIDPLIVNLLIEIYKSVVEILREICYPIGFDMYVSDDGTHFDSIVMKGLRNPDNYGGRILYVDNHDKLYIGTANPFQGCEVWEAVDIGSCDICPCDEKHYESLWKAKKIMNEKYDIISQNMPVILQFIPKKYYHRFI